MKGIPEVQEALQILKENHAGFTQTNLIPYLTIMQRLGVLDQGELRQLMDLTIEGASADAQRIKQREQELLQIVSESADKPDY